MRCLLVLVFLSSACGELATAEYAGLTVFEAPSGVYLARYLAPPWELDEESSEGDTLRLRIASNAESFGGTMSGVPDKYEVTFDVIGGDAETRAAQDAASWMRNAESFTGPRTIISDTGVEAHEVLGLFLESERLRYRRTVYFPRRGGVLRIRFAGNPDLDDPEVDAMVRSTEIDLAP